MSCLSNNKSKSTIFQKCWNTYPDWTLWQFKIVGYAEGLIDAKHFEAKLVFDTDEKLRLNSKNTSNITYERRQKILSMLAENIKYSEICKTTGVSMGTISKIKYGRL